MSRTQPLSETMTVHEAVRRIPGAHEIFRRFGIDACCGGDLPLSVAAERHGVDPGQLLAALETAAAARETTGDAGS